MNRREALAALVSLPAVAKISVAQLKPTDVIVFECDGYVSSDVAERIKAMAGQIWPDQKVIVCDKGLRLKVVEGSQL